MALPARDPEPVTTLRGYLEARLRSSEVDVVLDAMRDYIDTRLAEQERRLRQEWMREGARRTR